VPFLRYEYIRIWWETRGGGEWPESDLAVILAREAGRLVGIAPMFFSFNRDKVPALLLIGSVEVSDYLDIISRVEDIPEFLRGLFVYLNSPAFGQGTRLATWKALDWYNLLDSSPTLTALPAAAKYAGWTSQEEVLQHSPYIVLPGDWETYLAGIDKKQRHEIRRKMRRAEESQIPMRWYVAAEASTIRAEAEAFIGMMAQDADKAKFLTPPMREHMANVIECAYQTGCLQLAFLEVDGVKAASYLSFKYLNRVWVYNSGIDRQFMEYSPGWVLLGYLLKFANETGIKEFDFMRGDEDYKYKFGAVDRYVKRAVICR
jgi:CelD/BcsL family acetyltransferase involved in cellulose biosynthesis